MVGWAAHGLPLDYRIGTNIQQGHDRQPLDGKNEPRYPEPRQSLTSPDEEDNPANKQDDLGGQE